jgi:RNA polymerase sigma factor (sigma-70 family)
VILITDSAVRLVIPSVVRRLASPQRKASKTTGTGDEWEALFVSCLGTIDSIVLALARARGLKPEDAADLASLVRLHLLRDNYAVLRKFQGRSSLKTYLAVVIHRVYLDERIARFGKWRSSRQAKREGPMAMLFERLRLRDGLTFDEARAAIAINHGVEIPHTTPEGAHRETRLAPPRRFVSTDQSLEELPALSDSPDEPLARAERTALAERARCALTGALAALDPQDRRLLHLRFACGWSIADIARATGLKQRTLYSRCAQLLRTLRAHLELAGLVGAEVMETVGRSDMEWH